MIRIEEPTGWILIRHQDHARLAGEMAAHWGNAEFLPPKPRREVLLAVNRHDDAWVERDRAPHLTKEGRPGAYSRELVGAYSAFEEIDLADYLAVRGRATEVVAADNPYAAVLISLHTVNLLTERADTSRFSEKEKELHGSFIARQTRRQGELARMVAADLPSLQRPFEFLQACDSLSLTVCVRYPAPLPLRHRHPKVDGTSETITCTPVGPDTYRLTPYPLDADALVFRVACRRLRSVTFPSQEHLREAFEQAAPDALTIRLVR